MALTFPSSPTNGQTYTYNGDTYTFDGKRWTLPVSLAGGTATISALDADPVSPVIGETYFNTTADELRVWSGSYWGKLPIAKLGSYDRPANNAQEIIDAGDSFGDGVYWFQPSGYAGAPFQVYCDMTSFGGGWMLVSKWYQDAPYSVDEIFNANARNATTSYLLNGSHLTAKSTHARLSRDQMNALWGQSNHIARIESTEGTGSTASPYGTYFQKKITNTNGFDFWNAHYNARMWSDDNFTTSYTTGWGTYYKVMRYETSGNIFTDGTYTDFAQPALSHGHGWWDHVTQNAPNYGTIYISRHMGFYGDIYEGNQWLLTCNPSDSRFTATDSSEGKRSMVFLK